MLRTNEIFLKEEIGFYNKLNQNEKEFLISNLFTRNISKGELIHSSNEHCMGMLIVKGGRLRVYILSEEGREITLYYIEKGEICVLSASCVLNSISFQVNIEAQEDTMVMQIPSSVFSRLQEQNIYVENYALKIAVQRFSDVMWAMQQILFFSMDKRLAMFLYDQVVKNNNLELNITHEHIAKELGSAREVVTRLLQQFVKKNIVKVERGKIIVIDKKELLKYTS